MSTSCSSAIFQIRMAQSPHLSPSAPTWRIRTYIEPQSMHPLGNRPNKYHRVRNQYEGENRLRNRQYRRSCGGRFGSVCGPYHPDPSEWLAGPYSAPVAEPVRSNSSLNALIRTQQRTRCRNFEPWPAKRQRPQLIGSVIASICSEPPDKYAKRWLVGVTKKPDEPPLKISLRTCVTGSDRPHQVVQHTSRKLPRRAR
jgi:hypothetical protein